MSQQPTPTHTHKQKLRHLNTNYSQTEIPLTYSNSNLQSQLSITEQQIFSHQIVSQIFEKSRKNTVSHHVNFIPVQTKLYVQKNAKENLDINGQGRCQGQRGNRVENKQFVFDTIPPKEKDYVCSAAVKVNQIKRRLSEGKNLAERLTQIAQKNKQKCAKYKKMRAISADNVNKRVSISGLVTYNFNSVNARRSLGSIPDQPQQQKLHSKIQSQQTRTSHSLDRRQHIIQRKPTPSSLHQQQLSKASICDFHTETDKFLALLHRESKKDELIYGQKMEKLTCIKQYMEKQKTDFQNAKYIVDTVIKAGRKGGRVGVQAKRYVVDDDQELAKRRTVVKGKRKVMLKHLYFTEV